MPGEGNLGMTVDAPRRPVVIQRRRFLSQRIGHGQHALGERHMGQLRSVDQVTDRPDTRLRGAATTVYLDKTALVDHHRSTAETQPVGVGPAADRHHYQFNVHRLAVAEGHGRVRRRRVDRMAVDRSRSVYCDPAFLEAARHHLGRVAVASSQYLVQRLDHGDLYSEVGHH